jgi:mono/diheme cytochrome c family protein
MLPSVRWLSAALLVSSSFLLASCLEQYDPRPNNARLHKEWEQSVNLPPKLAADGSLPPEGGNKVVDAEERFKTLCSNCHGPTGHGDGPGGAALTPHPRNFHLKDWQASVNDQHIADVIMKGGAAMGLSPMMAPWGSVLSDAEVAALVKKIRKFGQEP